MSTLPNEVREKALLEMKLAPWPLRNDNYADRDKYVGKIFDAALSALEAAGWVCVPVKPSDGLLMSMAVRYDHGLGVPGHYDQPIYAKLNHGITHEQRLQGALTTMRQLHEEVVGAGFYSAEREENYAALLTASNPKEKPDA